MILNDLLRSELALVASYASMGGAAPQEYRQYRRFDALRRARLLKFNGRRNVRWDRTFFDITYAGRKALALSSTEEKSL